MRLQQEIYTTCQFHNTLQSPPGQSEFFEAGSPCPAFSQSSSTSPQNDSGQSAQFTAPSSTTGPSLLFFSQAHVPTSLSVTPHTSSHVSFSANGQSLVRQQSFTPHTSFRHSFCEGVCAETQLLGGAAVVNNIYVPPPRVPYSIVSRQVSAISRRPAVSPRVVLNLRTPSFQPLRHSAGLDFISTSKPCSFTGRYCSTVAHYRLCSSVYHIHFVYSPVCAVHSLGTR